MWSKLPLHLIRAQADYLKALALYNWATGQVGRRISLQHKISHIPSPASKRLRLVFTDECHEVTSGTILILHKVSNLGRLNQLRTFQSQYIFITMVHANQNL